MISIYAGDNLIGIINPIPKISGKVQKVESLGDVMDAKVQEWKSQPGRLDWGWFNRCNMSVLNAEAQVLNWDSYAS